MGQTISLPDHLYERLHQIAGKRNVSMVELLEQWATVSEPGPPPTEPVSASDEALVACTRALREGRTVHAEADWEEIAMALAQSEPLYPTVEEAMSALRHRDWTKDS